MPPRLLHTSKQDFGFALALAAYDGIAYVAARSKVASAMVNRLFTGRLPTVSTCLLCSRSLQENRQNAIQASPKSGPSGSETAGTPPKRTYCELRTN